MVMCMDGKTRKTVGVRLASATGHLKGIERMIAEDAHCIDTIRQIQAVQAALHKVNLILLEAHLHGCVSEAVNGDDPTERERMLQEVTSLFTTAGKL
jgi:CsoR family transcriptional regulator, copper-sensing transcriptional repressor